MKTKFLFFSLISFILMNVYGFAQSSRNPIPKMNKKMYKHFLETNCVYPENSLKAGEEGTVEINFYTDKSGNVISKRIIKSVNNELDKEALRLFNLIEWEPALDYGIPIEGNASFELTFKVKKYNKILKRRTNFPKKLDLAYDTSYHIYGIKQIDTIAEPILPRGINNLYKYIYSEMHYPKQAVELGIEGKVIINFVIETSGLPSNIIVEQTVGGGCTEEALRIVSDIKWVAAIKNGKVVRSRKQLFIEFRLALDGNGNYIPNQTNSGF